MGSKHRRRRGRQETGSGNAFGQSANGRTVPSGYAAPEDPYAGLDDRAIARDAIAQAARQVQVDPRRAGQAAASVAAYFGRVDERVMVATIEEWLSHIVTSVVEGGWAPTDLVEIIQRNAYARHLPILAALLVAETDRHPDDTVAPQWSADLERLPAPVRPDLRAVSDLEDVFGLAGILIGLPTIEQTIAPPGSRPWGPADSADTKSSKHLTRVRALLAKAESTESPEEAEALSAKAQELISRYALDRLLHEPDPGATQVVARRIWLDSPYVRAKATLVHEIAEANRCRAVFSKAMEFMTVVGEHGDLDAVDLMTASLLVQAQSAMLVHGSQIDRRGTSRTRSFRQSFLIAYAARVGERLHAATEEAAAETGEEKALVPVLRRRAEQVDAARDEMFPQLVTGSLSSATNGHGWAAGRAAADLASLDAHKNVTARA